MKVLVPILTTLVVASTIAHAQTPSRSMPTPMNASVPPASAATVLADAVVQSVDAERGVMTLKHGAIANIAMPPMTMRYAVADRKMLGTAKAGDKVRFCVENAQRATDDHAHRSRQIGTRIGSWRAGGRPESRRAAACVAAACNAS